MPHRSEQPATRVGDLRRLSMTVPQAAQILDVEAKEVRTAIDRHVVTAALVQQGGRSFRTLDGIDVLRLRMRGVLHHGVGQRLYSALKKAPDGQRLDQPFQLEGLLPSEDSAAAIFNVVHDMATRTVFDARSLRADQSSLVDEDGRLRGTDVEAHRVAALATGGMSADEIVRDYPNLSAPLIDAAIAYARTNPKRGRPYPARTAKSTLRKGGGGGLAAAFVAARDHQDRE